jgi:hypothetical protein
MSLIDKIPEAWSKRRLRFEAHLNPLVGFHAELSRFFHREVSHL